MTDQALLQECLAGKPSAQKALYERYGPKVMAVCMRYARHREEAEDLFQDTMVLVFTKLDKIKDPATMGAWMKRIAVNQCIDRYHKNKPRQFDKDITEAECYPDRVEDAIEALSAQELTLLISRLPDGYRQVFNLYEVEGFTHKEIGKMLKIAEGTSKSQLSKAKAMLKRLIREQELVWQ